jgi:hypothetical protein
MARGDHTEPAHRTVRTESHASRSRSAPEHDPKGPSQIGPGTKKLLAESDVTIGRLLGDARQMAGLPQSHAARHMGWPQSRLANLELGRRRLLFVEALLLADLYSVPVSAFDPRVATPAPSTGRRRRTDIRG